MDSEMVLELIKSRRSVRAYTDEPLTAAEIDRIIEAGMWAPSGSNIQGWMFIAVTEPDRVAELNMVSPGMFGRPAAVFALCSDRDRLRERAGRLADVLALTDVAMAAQNMMLMAHGLGLGSCVIRSFSQPAVSELLDLPDRYRPELVLAVGHPAEMPSPPERRPTQEVVRRERY